MGAEGPGMRGRVEIIHGDGPTPLFLFDAVAELRDLFDAAIGEVTRRPMVPHILRMITATNVVGLLERIGRFIREHFTTQRYSYAPPGEEETLVEDDISAMVARLPGCVRHPRHALPPLSTHRRTPDPSSDEAAFVTGHPRSTSPRTLPEHPNPCRGSILPAPAAGAGLCARGAGADGA